jgi:hypothetical protein
MCSTSDATQAHHWTAYPEAGDGEEVCDACGARPGTPEADGPCYAPRPDNETPPEPWEFWPGGSPEIIPGYGGTDPPG